MSVEIRHLAAADPDFASCFAIRLEVFVGEQKVSVDEERDDLDAVALHLLALRDGIPSGTARVIIKENGAAKISRVAVLKAARGRGLGGALIIELERELPLVKSFALDAQLQALAFYERRGYAAIGEMFMEAGIAHRHMVKPPDAGSGRQPD